jgi:hypothetical protein
MSQIHWANPIDGRFLFASNWSGGVVPRMFQDTILNLSHAVPRGLRLAPRPLAGQGSARLPFERRDEGRVAQRAPGRLSGADRDVGLRWPTAVN